MPLMAYSYWATACLRCTKCSEGESRKICNCFFAMSLLAADSPTRYPLPPLCFFADFSAFFSPGTCVTGIGAMSGPMRFTCVSIIS